MPSGGAKDAVVFVETVPAAADSAVAARPTPRLAQRDQMFEPRVLPVVVGGVVDFPNLDPIYHNVFSVSPVRRFDLGKYPRGQSRRVEFPRTGVVQVYCDIHADMAAFIVVVPNRHFAQPAADGAYALPPLPPGRYTVRVWHPDRREAHHEVVLPDRGDVTFDVSL
jgi:plastocyanin